MASNGWREVTLGSLLKIKHGYPFKSELFSEELTGQPIVVAVGNFQYTGGFRFESTAVKEYRGDYPKEFELEPRDVLLVMTCQTAGGEILGIPGRVPDDGRVYLHNQRLGKVIVTRPDLTTIDYLYWLFLWRDFNQELVASSSGTKIVHTAPSRIEAFKFALPPLGEQRTIARILCALDDKIELNRRMNRTLEGMAQALFKSWFVDFDPVTAKAAGRKPYGMNEETAALFSDRFEDSDLGLIPEGWQIGKVSDFANITSGKRPGNRSKTRTPEINIPLFGGGGVMGYAEKPLFELPILLTGRVGTLGEIFRITYPCWASDNTLVLLSKEPQSYEYLYFQLLDIDFQSLNRGSTQPLVTQGDLQKQSLLLPAPEVLKAFSKSTSKLFNRCDSNDEENNTLAALRDELLPKLLSGEIRVRQAENLVAEAV